MAFEQLIELELSRESKYAKLLVIIKGMISEMIVRLMIILGMVLALSACYASSDKDQQTRQLSFPAQVKFVNSHNQSVASIKAAVADDIQAYTKGLMHVKDLPAHKGMIFIFKQAKPRQFWMANTPLPLDMIFINKQHRIVHIHHHAQPNSRQKIASHGAVLYVVETNAGFTKRHHIEEGMTIKVNRSSS